MSKKHKHKVHKYMRVEWGKKNSVIWRCVLPDCSHYVSEGFALNRASLCWLCGEEFILTTKKLARKKPKCDACQSRHSSQPWKETRAAWSGEDTGERDTRKKDDIDRDILSILQDIEMNPKDLE